MMRKPNRAATMRAAPRLEEKRDNPTRAATMRAAPRLEEKRDNLNQRVATLRR